MSDFNEIPQKKLKRDKIMKIGNFKGLIAAAALSCSVLMVSCSDMLEPNVYSELAPETFFTSEGDFNQALVSLYSPFRVDWGGIYNADPTRYLGRSMLVTDELHSQWWSLWTHFSFGPTSNEGHFGNVRTVAQATDIINQIENSEADVSEAVKARYLAEAKTLRAWLNHTLFDFFGPVPVRMDPETLHSLDILPRPSEEEFIGYIEQDLNDALPELDASYHNDSGNWGRVTQGTARMILLRTYMNTHQWAKAEQVARDIMDMGIYQLQDDYYSVFNVQANSEIIHAIPGTPAAPNWWLPEVLTGNFGSAVPEDLEFSPNFTGWTVYWMPWDFYETFDPEDDRRRGILSRYMSTGGSVIDRAGGMQGAIPIKFTEIANPGNQGQPIDMPVFRYAEVMLSLAEAINEQRGPSEAYQYVNPIRVRADLEPLSGLSQSEFRDALLRERGFEFHGEGLRRQDLIRHGKLIENAQARGRDAQPHQTRFPIPNNVITQGEGIIEQNPGY